MVYYYSAIKELYTLDENGVHIQIEIINYRLPLFLSNGKDEGDIIEADKNSVTIKMRNFIYKIGTNGIVNVSNEKYANRNGDYCLGNIEKSNSKLTINLNLSKVQWKKSKYNCHK